MVIPLEPLSLSELSTIQVRFFRGRLRRNSKWSMLIIQYPGVCRHEGIGNPDARYMRAMGEAGVTAWEPDGAIFDLSELKFRWDDALDSISTIGTGVFGNENLPLAIVVGPEREGFVHGIIPGLDSERSD